LFTIGAFRDSFPEFADTVKYSNAVITVWSTLAIAQVNANLWGSQTDLGVMLYTAHEITLAAQNQAAGVIGGTPGNQGLINSKTVGSVSAGYDTDKVTERDGGYWNQTTYGRQFLRLARIFGAGCIQL
jgi:Protein of unknown function (DUF4054)